MRLSARGFDYALLAALVGGSLLRFAPIEYGLPFIYHPDESFLITNLAKSLEGLSRGATTVGMSTFYYPLAVLYGIYFAVGRLTGRFQSIPDFKEAVLLDDPTLHLIGRALSAAVSVAAILAVYLVARRVYDRRGGIIAAVLMAVSLIDISSSHWLKFDSAVAFMGLISLIACFRVMDAPDDWRPVIVAGVVIGLAAATRIDLAIFVPVLIVAAVLGPHTRTARFAIGAPLAAAVVIAVAVYALCSFQLINVIGRAVFGARDVFTTREYAASMLQFLSVGDVWLTVRHNLMFYLRDVLVGLGGVALTIAVAIGVGRALATRTRAELLVLCFVALAGAAMLLFNVYATHYFLPVTPPLMVLAAGGILWLADRLERVTLRAWIALLVIVGAQPAFYSLQYVRYVMTNTDTRTRGREWLLRHVPVDTRIAVQKYDELPRYVPPIDESVARIRVKLDITRKEGRGSGLGLEAQLSRPSAHPYAIVNLSSESYWNRDAELENAYDLEALRASGVRYVVTSGYNNPSWEPNEDRSPWGLVLAERVIDRPALGRYRSFMTSLREHADLSAEFVARDPTIARRSDAPVDPTIRIYRLR